MKKRKIVVGASIACLCIAAVAIQATFGGGIGLKIDPPVITVKPGSTIAYDITLSSYDPDCFDITIIPYSCDIGWFEWTEKERVCVAARGKEQISLKVTPTGEGNFQFKVKAESRSNPRTCAIAIALINSEPPPTPTPTPTPTNKPPTCIGLTPNLPEPQKIMTEDGTKAIKWTTFACDPDGDQIWYRFCLVGPGTGDTEQIVQDWSTSNEWVWPATLNDQGDSIIYVDVRDGYHNTDFTTPDYDDSCNKNYMITINQQPYCACLMPNKFSLRLIGTEINWTACALDAEGDQDSLWYRFWLKGPETGNVWLSKRYWSTDNTWTWIPTTSGAHDIEVWIRDNFIPPLSEDPESWDVYATYWTYEIT